MAGTKHTPGSWKYQENADAYTHIVRGPTGQFIASCPQGTDGEDEANARLLAAAPDMLEALEKIADNYGGCRCNHTTADCCEKVGEFCPHCIAETAISRARGGAREGVAK